jgi:hypothetical protein
MATRKETPDLLGELLGESSSRSSPAPEEDSSSPVDIQTELVAANGLDAAPAVEASPVKEDEPPVKSPGEPEAVPRARSQPARRRRASHRRRRPERPRWEYVEIVFQDHGGYRPRYISGLESRSWKKAPLIYDYLNYLGQQGWELAGICGPHKDQLRAYLKRLKL